MPTPAQTTALSSAILALRNAQNMITGQIRAATDTLTAIRLTHEYNTLDASLSALLHAQNATDDASFADSVDQIHCAMQGVQLDQQKLATIIQDVHIAAKVMDYLTQALELVAKL